LFVQDTTPPTKSTQAPKATLPSLQMSPSTTPQTVVAVQGDATCLTNDDLFYSTPEFLQEFDKAESIARQAI